MAPILGVLFAILIGILAIRPYLDYQQRSFENIKIADTAAQFRQILDAVRSYVQSNYATASGSIPLSQLAAYLPSNVSATNPYGQQWHILVSTASGSLQALVYSSDGIAIPEGQAPEIAAETGADGGFVPYAGQYNNSTTSAMALGAYGYWHLNLSQYNISPGAGHLVGLLVFGANGTLDNSYLYRVPVTGDSKHILNTMQTDLDMGTNYSINNAKSVQANQSIGISPSQETPYLSDMAVTTDSSGALEGEVQTTNQAGTNTTTMESDSQQSSATISAAASGSSKNQVTMTANNTQASLSLTGGNSGNALTLISAPQKINVPCSESQAGTIAPNIDSTGRPLVCMTKTSETETLNVATVHDQNYVYNISESEVPEANNSTEYSWQLLDGNSNFLTTQDLNNLQQGPGFYYRNDTSKPFFISSACTPATAGGLLAINSASVIITIQGPNSYSSSSNEVGLAGLTLLQFFYAAPQSSAIVPPGYVFNYTTTGVGNCSFMVTY